MRAAGKALGTSARIVAETVRTALLPFALVNLGVRKFESYLREKFADELDEATAHIPEESLQEPPLNVAGPVMQGLTFTHESEELRRMFLALLATSMDATKTGSTHPAFADVIRQLDPDEAQVLEAVLAADLPLDLLQYEVTADSGGTRILRRATIPVLRAGEPVLDEKLSRYVDNWSRLGLVETITSREFTHSERYGWVDSWPLTVALRALHREALVITRGGLYVTDWGEQFARAINVPSSADNPYTVIIPEFIRAARAERAKAEQVNPSSVVVDGGSA